MLLLLLGLALAESQTAYSAAYRLSLSSAGLAGGDCQDSTNGFLAGMEPVLLVQILPSARHVTPSDYAGVLSRQWPEGLQVEVGLSGAGGTDFASDPALAKQIRLQYYVDRFEAYSDSIWRQSGRAPQFDPAPHFRLKYYLPESLIGKRICFRVSYNSTRYGNLTSNVPECVSVRRPCSRMDTTLIRIDLIQSAYDLQQWSRLLDLNDSLAQADWASLITVSKAWYAAQQLGQYEKAIMYMDACFQKFGSIIEGEGTSDSGSEADRRIYETARARLQQLLNQQHQR